MDKVVNMEDVRELEEISGGKLGKMSKVLYKNSVIAMRTINLIKVTSYLVDDLDEELENLYMLNSPHVLPLLGTSIDLPKIYLFMPYMPNSSMAQALHGELHTHFSFFEKLRISIEIARSLKELHSQAIFHGNLKSENVLFDE
jgi:serine/threonine protein kinase